MAALIRKVGELDRRIKNLENNSSSNRGTTNDIVHQRIPVFCSVEDLENIPPKLVSHMYSLLCDRVYMKLEVLLCIQLVELDIISFIMYKT